MHSEPIPWIAALLAALAVAVVLGIGGYISASERQCAASGAACTAEALAKAGNYKGALDASQQELMSARQRGGDLIRPLRNLADIHASLSQYSEAQEALEEALSHARDDETRAKILSDLGIVYMHLKHDDAEQMLLKAIALFRDSAHPMSADAATALNNLASFYYYMSSYAKAEEMARQVLAMRKTALQSNDPDLAEAYDNLGEILRIQNEAHEAEQNLQEGLRFRRQYLPQTHPDLAISLNNIAVALNDAGRYLESIPLLEEAIRIDTAAYWPRHLQVATDMQNLAEVYKALGRFGQALTMHEQVLSIRRENLPPTDAGLLISLNNIGNLESDLQLYDRALAHHNEVIASSAKVNKNGTIETAYALNGVGEIAREQRNYAAALEKYAAARGVLQAISEGDIDAAQRQPLYAVLLHNEAATWEAKGDLAAAEAKCREALELRLTTLSSSHPNIALERSLLARILAAQNKLPEALALSRQATAAVRARQSDDISTILASQRNEMRSLRTVLETHLSVVYRAREARLGDLTELFDEAFRTAQLAEQSEATVAASQRAIRLKLSEADGDDLVRRAQDASRALNDLKRRRMQMPDVGAAADTAALQEADAQIAALSADLGGLTEQVRRRAPREVSLADAEVLDLTSFRAKARLGPSSALVFYSVGKSEGYVFVFRPLDGGASGPLHAVWERLPEGAETLNGRIKALRRALDPTKRDGQRGVALTDTGETDFDVQEAFNVYRAVWSPIERHLVGVDEVLVRPSGALQSLPLAVLVDSAPSSAPTGWLVRRFAFATLTSFDGLLRAQKERGAAGGARSRIFLGIGDPDLGPDGRAISGEEVLYPLSETATELKALSDQLGASRSDVFLGEAATEPALAKIRWDQYQYIAFATHGLLGGVLSADAEPGLVLTQSPGDDGFLSSSEIARLRFDADLVVLSACDTAAGNGDPEAEALSGLAATFLYAGVRSLLVSHWPVYSDAAVQISTTTIQAMSREGLGESRALQRAMLRMINDPPQPKLAEPSAWAPFVLVAS